MIKICKFFMQGNCKKDNCKFLHDPQICKDKYFKGHCEDKKCKLRHKFNLGKKKGSKKKKNTQNFNPSHQAPEMRIICAEPGIEKYNRDYQVNDVVMVSDLFGKHDDLSIYNNLLKEIAASGIDSEKLWKLWHGDTHLIADDNLAWKEHCPTFKMVIEKMQKYFNMDIKATRFNWYRDSSEWKPFHHDAAAVKPHIAKKQNFTVGISFGAERDIAFEHDKSKTVISFPLHNGNIFSFGKDVNIKWKHGIPQIPPEKQHNKGRISIIAWGYIEQSEIN